MTLPDQLATDKERHKTLSVAARNLIDGYFARILADRSRERRYALRVGFFKERLDVAYSTGVLPSNARMTRASDSHTLLRASFKIELHGESTVVATVGQAYRFITSLSPVECLRTGLQTYGVPLVRAR
jgi:hypothetical protein